MCKRVVSYIKILQSRIGFHMGNLYRITCSTPQLTEMSCVNLSNAGENICTAESLLASSHTKSNLAMLTLVRHFERVQDLAESHSQN